MVFIPGTIDGSGRSQMCNLAVSRVEYLDQWDARTLIEEEHPRDDRWVDPDGTHIVIEIRVGERYKVIEYAVDSDIEKGKELVGKVQILENALKIQLLP